MKLLVITELCIYSNILKKAFPGGASGKEPAS